MMKRKQYEIIKSHVDKREFTIITGARQIGKTTILKQLQQDLEQEGRAVVFLNLDRKTLLGELNESPENVFNYISNDETKRTILLIDEIQYLEDPTNFIKLLYDEYAAKIKIVATGSSAFYIDKNFKDSLAGRKRIFELKTLDFEEFLEFKSENKLVTELLKLREGKIKSSLFEPQLWFQLEEYLTYGGYPAVVLENNIENKIDHLYELRDSFLKRDILESGVNNEEKFYKLCILLASQIGNLLNTNELAKTLQLSNPTVENYLYILQKCFHISLVKPFYNNLRKELTKMPKVYFNDIGLRNAMLENFGKFDLKTDKGAILENLVFRRLSEKYPSNQLKFWRTTEGNEVDFIIEESQEARKAFEVKFSETEVKPKKYNIFQQTYAEIDFKFLTWKNSDLLKL
jgi:predicted AAA+ superfamily ATPase